MPTAEVDAVPLEELQLVGREHKVVILRVLLNAEEALEAGLEVVVEPNAADAGGLTCRPRRELIGDTLDTLGGMIEGVGENLRFELGGDEFGMRSPGAAALLEEDLDAADLEGRGELVEGVAVIALDAISLGDVSGAPR